MKYIFNFLKKIISDKNTNIFAISVFISLIFFSLVSFFGAIPLWFSLLTLVISSVYFSVTFFRTRGEFDKLYYYFAVLFFVIAYFATAYYFFGIIDSSTNEIVRNDLLNSFYFSVVTWTTLGYGDFKPIPDMKPFVMAEALLGYLFMAMLVGKLIYFASKDTKEKNLKK